MFLVSLLLLLFSRWVVPGKEIDFQGPRKKGQMCHTVKAREMLLWILDLSPSWDTGDLHILSLSLQSGLGSYCPPDLALTDLSQDEAKLLGEY